MTVGLSEVNLANKWLDMLRAQAFTAPSNLYVQIHTDDPGSDGTANVSAVTTRSELILDVAAGGAITITGTLPTWTMTALETISHISVWDATSAGNFLLSAILTVAKVVDNGDSLTLTTCGLSLTPLAA